MWLTLPMIIDIQFWSKSGVLLLNGTDVTILGQIENIVRQFNMCWDLRLDMTSSVGEKSTLNRRIRKRKKKILSGELECNVCSQQVNFSSHCMNKDSKLSIKL